MDMVPFADKKLENGTETQDNTCTKLNSFLKSAVRSELKFLEAQNQFTKPHLSHICIHGAQRRTG